MLKSFGGRVQARSKRAMVKKGGKGERERVRSWFSYLNFFIFCHDNTLIFFLFLPWFYLDFPSFLPWFDLDFLLFTLTIRRRSAASSTLIFIRSSPRDNNSIEILRSSKGWSVQDLWIIWLWRGVVDHMGYWGPNMEWTVVNHMGYCRPYEVWWTIFTEFPIQKNCCRF